jgi:class 3 adenylate cyclase
MTAVSADEECDGIPEENGESTVPGPRVTPMHPPAIARPARWTRRPRRGIFRELKKITGSIMPREERGVLFADVSDSTALYDTLGDEAARKVVMACLDHVRESVLTEGGTVIERIGDELLCSFPSPAATLRGGVAIQRGLKEARTRSLLPRRLALRVGCHFGEVIVEDGSLFGDTLYVAARMVQLAKGEQILVTESTLNALGGADDGTPTRFVDRTHVKGRREPVAIHEVLWDWGESMTEQDDSREQDTWAPGYLTLFIEGEEHRVDPSNPRITIGRDPDCDVTIEHPRVSRTHALIELRRSRFILKDMSTNGTWVRTPDGAEQFVRREERVLEREGELVFGKSEAGVASVHFRQGAAD